MGLGKGYRGATEKAGASAQGAADFGSNMLGPNWNKMQSADRTARGYSKPIEDFSKSLIPAGGGKLSPYAAEELAANREQIGRDYGDVTRTGLKTAASRGMGGLAPNVAASISNTAGRNEGESETAAVRDAFNRTYQGGLEGIHGLQGLQQFGLSEMGIFDPTRTIGAITGSAGTAADAAAARSKMGTTAGDIGAGLQGIAPMFV